MEEQEIFSHEGWRKQKQVAKLAINADEPATNLKAIVTKQGVGDQNFRAMGLVITKTALAIPSVLKWLVYA